MKILTVTLMLLVVKGTEGAVIPKNESESNNPVHWQQLYWDISNIGNDLANIGLGALADTEIGRSIRANLTNIEKLLNGLIESSVSRVSSFGKGLSWNGASITHLVINETALIHKKLMRTGEQLQEAIGNKTIADVHKKLEKFHKDLRHYGLNQTQITKSVDKVYHGVTHLLEENRNNTNPYTRNMIKQVQGVRDYFTSVAEMLKEGLNILVKLSAGSTTA
ncbi:uncharacterized protein LOC121269564 [Carcharodon carcharias]|uniref:uncharacterized protein LOC121269564 n=1 Tax=Carcharodon carcharias TaxID=13397 RepID=UPI001B7DC3E4|nr:uncharacterized protein LOC121269564 [Carcharodon carcharias]